VSPPKTAMPQGTGAGAGRNSGSIAMPIRKRHFDTLRIAPFFTHPVSPRLIVAVLIALTALKLLIVPAFYNFEIPVREIGFGFGATAQAVAETGLTAVCPPLFLDAPNLHCAVVERMPLIPYLYAGAMKLVGDNALRVAVLKTAILDLLLLYFVARWLAIVGADRFTLMLIAFVFAGPQYMLHSFSPPRYLPFARGIRRDSIPQRRVRLARSRRLRLFPRCAPATSCARLAFDGQIAEVVQRMIWASKRPSASLEPKIG
jgi:hypothetical protein